MLRRLQGVCTRKMRRPLVQLFIRTPRVNIQIVLWGACVVLLGPVEYGREYLGRMCEDIEKILLDRQMGK